MWTVGAKRPSEVKYRIVCKTPSRAYAMRVARKWARKGYQVVIDEEQNEEL
jgi:hypothetical protein